MIEFATQDVVRSLKDWSITANDVIICPAALGWQDVDHTHYEDQVGSASEHHALALVRRPVVLEMRVADRTRRSYQSLFGIVGLILLAIKRMYPMP